MQCPGGESRGGARGRAIPGRCCAVPPPPVPLHPAAAAAAPLQGSAASKQPPHKRPVPQPLTNGGVEQRPLQHLDERGTGVDDLQWAGQSRQAGGCQRDWRRTDTLLQEEGGGAGVGSSSGALDKWHKLCSSFVAQRQHQQAASPSPR